MFEDLGGIVEVIVLICAVLFYPVNEFNFFHKAIKNLYLVNTSDENLLVAEEDKPETLKRKAPT
jgi:hypothetical protein